MANLIVTFGKSLGGKLEYGPDARTETIEITGGHVEGTLTATGAEDVVTLYAEAACWVAIGTAPDAEAATVGSNRRFIKAAGERQLGIGAGMKVSVTAI